MSEELNDIGIKAGEETLLRGVTAPAEGDDYITSYYNILRAIERNTVYFEDNAANLPTPAFDGPLVGVAPSTSDDIDGETVYIYDDRENEWVDTFAPVEELIQELQDYVENLDVDDIEGLNNELETLAESIESLSVDDIEGLNNELETLAESIESLDVDDIEGLNNELETLAESIESLDVDDIEGLNNELETLEDDIGELNDELNTIKQDIERLDVDDIDGLNNELDTIKQDIESLDVSDIEGITDEIETALADITQEVDDLNTKVDDEIEQLEERIDELEDSVGGIYIDDVAAPSTVESPEGVTVEATIQNTSGAPISDENINLSVEGSTVDTIIPSINFDEKKTVELDWDTSDERGEYTLDVSTSENNEQFSVEVLKPAELDIVDTNLDYSDPLLEGDTATIEATVENIGDVQAVSETVSLLANNSEVDAATPTVGGGDTQVLEFRWEPDTADDYSLSVETDTHSQLVSESIEVLLPATTDISDIDHPASVIQGQTATIDATITNNGDVPTGQKDVSLMNDSDEVVSSDTVDVGSGETDTASLSWETDEERGDKSVTVLTDDDSESITITVEKPATLEIESTAYDDTTIPDQTNAVDVTIANTGDIDAADQDVSLKKGGSKLDSETRTIRSGDTTTFSFEWSTKSLGTHDLTVETDDSSRDSIVSRLESEDLTVAVEDVVTINEINTRGANNVQSGYQIVFDIGEVVLGDSVYMEAETAGGSATWSATLSEDDSTHVEQDGSHDVSHLANIDIYIYDNVQKDRLIYGTTVSANSSYSDLTSVSDTLDLPPKIVFNEIDTGGANNVQSDYNITFDMGEISTGSVYVEAETSRATGGTATWSATLSEEESTRVEQDESYDVSHAATINLRVYNSERKDELLYQRDVSANSSYSNISSLGPRMAVFNEINTNGTNNRESSYRIDFDTGMISIGSVYIEAETNSATWSGTLSEDSYTSVSQDGNHDVPHDANINLRVYDSASKEQQFYQKSITPNNSYSDIVTLNRHFVTE